MDKILENPWLGGLIVLFTQVVFLFFRTLNVIYTAERKVLKSIVTGNIIGITWLVSIAIGANAILTLQWQPIVGHLIGGTIGVFLGFKKV